MLLNGIAVKPSPPFVAAPCAKQTEPSSEKSAFATNALHKGSACINAEQASAAGTELAVLFHGNSPRLDRG
jgi:hypothetical protein